MSPAQRDFAELVRSRWSGGAVGLEPIDEAGRLLGPFDLMAASPGIGHAVLAVAGSFKDSSLSVAERELVIVLVAAESGSDFMWRGHVPLLTAAGVGDEVVASIRAHAEPGLDGTMAVVHEVAWALIRHGDITDEEFSAAEAALGWRRLQEIVWLIGLYDMLALAMRVARTPVPADA